MIRRRAVWVVLLLVASSVPGCLGGGADPFQQRADMPAYQGLLWPEPFTNVTIDVDHHEDWPPTQEHLERLRDEVERLTPKDGVDLQDPEPFATGPEDGTWSTDELNEVARQTFDGDWATMAQDDRMVLQVVYVDGEHDGDPLRGVYTQGPTLFIFIEEIRTLDPSDAVAVDQPEEIASDFERATLIHEFGHALGLVGCGIDMQTERESDQYPCHSTNEESVMHVPTDMVDAGYEQIQGGEGLPYEFDEHDEADIAAFRSLGEDLRNQG